MASAGEVFLTARPDTSQFSPELQRYLRALKPSVDVEVRADESKFQDSLRTISRAGHSVKVNLEAELNNTTIRNIQRQLQNAVKALKVKVTPFIDKNAYKAVMRDLKVLTADRTVRIIADADTRVAADDLALLTRPQTVQINANANTAAAAAQLAALGNQTVTVNANVNAPGIAGLGGGGGGKGGLLGGFLKSLTSLPMIAGQALPAIASIGATLASMAPAAAVAVSALAAVKIATGVVKLGVMGMDDAFAAAFDPAKAEEFQKALDKLAPSAQKFVLAAKGLKPAFDSIQQGVQNKLFEGWGKQLTDVSSKVLPTLKTGLTGTAGVLNQMGDSAFRAVGNLQKTGVIKTILSGTNTALGKLKNAPGQVATGFAQIAAAAQPAFAKLTTAGGGAIQKITDKLSTAFSSGAMQKAIDSAVVLVQQLGSILGNVFSILGSVMGAAAAAGGQAFGVLGEVLARVAEIAKMPEVQAALTAVFKLLASVGQVIGSVVGPLLAALIPALKPIADALLPVVKMVGAALVQIVSAITPLLAPIGKLVAEVVGALMPILGPVIAIVVKLVQQLAGPLMSIVLAIIPVVRMLGEVFDAIFGALGPAIKPLIAIVGQIASVISGVFMGAITALMPSINALIPVVIQLVTMFVDLLQAVLKPILPLITQLAPLFGQVLMLAMSTLTPIIQMVANLFMQLIPLITPLIPVIGQLVTAVAQLIPPLVNLALQVLTPLMPLLVQVASLLTGVLGLALKALVPIIVTVLNAVIGFITKGLKALMPVIQSVTSFVKNYLGPLFKWITSGFRTLKDGVLGFWTSMFSSIKKIASGAWDLVKAGFSLFSGNFKQAFTNLKNGIGKIWSGLQGVAKAPVKFMVNTVYTGGIKKLWDTIAGKVGLGKLPAVNLPKGFATGGILPGYTPGRDVHVAALSGGEAVMRPEWTRAVGPEFVNRMNKAARTGGVSRVRNALGGSMPAFKDGGIFDKIPGSGLVKKGIGKVKDGLDWVKDIAKGALASVAKPVLNGLKSTVNKFIPQNPAWSGLMNATAKKPLDWVLDFFKKDDKKFNAEGGIGNYKPGAGVAQWAGLVKSLLAELGQPLSLVNTVLRRMNQESGGNPRAINNWDINAKNGDPSRGLMQTIGSTFNAYAGKYRSRGIYDPKANIYASMRYALSRYGSLSSAYNRPGGYAAGGTPKRGEVAWVGERGPELMQFGTTSRIYSNKESMAIAGGQQPLIGAVYQTLPDNANADDYANALAFEMRKKRMEGVGA
ncbi:transglycosylase SLT domain-containing protein [Streptomyces phaeochromogenes]|uniref:transglycosylase SLT domain-containing protein n=1 Tax=Streptomyces phaeochromogenes TaxID=1923 RepID=UPI002E2B1DA3|nr:transglycosylase SLT domain-containing protein [Streptomyces phaeochromogenes]